MKKHFLFAALFALLSCCALNAQLSGTKNIPGDYANLDLAIQALNSQGVGAGGVTLNLIPGNPQTTPLGGYTITAQGTSANTIVISGNNNTITTSASLTAGALNDGIFKIVGGDYITIQNFVMQENAANTITPTASNNMTEWGVAFIHASPTNGAQHNTILGNTISLNKAYANSIAIYLNSQHDATAVTTYSPVSNTTTGPSSFNLVNGNTISNVNIAVIMNGTASGPIYLDNQNSITGNTITNFSGQLLASSFVGLPANSYMFGVLVDYQNNYTISDNNFQTTLSTGGYDFRCIRAAHLTPAVLINDRIERNSIAYTLQAPAGISAAIYTTGSPGNNCNLHIMQNTIHNCDITSDSPMYGVYCSTIGGITNIADNIFRNNTVNAEASVYAFYNQGNTSGQINMTGNHIGDATGGAITFANPNSSGSFWGIYNSGGTATTALAIGGNDFRGITGSGYGSVYFIQNSGNCFTQNISSNTFTNLSINLSGAVYFIANNSTVPANGSVTVNSNSIVGSFAKTSGSGGVYLYWTNNASSPSTVTKTARFNVFSNITLSGDVMYGWVDVEGNSAGGPVKNISNNIFTNWSTGGGMLSAITVDKAGTNSTINLNTITGMSCSLQYSSLTGISLRGGAPSGNNAITNNTINTFTSQGDVIGIQVWSNNITTADVYGNVINGLTCTANYSTAGILVQSSGQTTNVFKNKIYDLQTSTGLTYGLSFAGSTQVNASNNLIGNLRAVNSPYAPAVVGISMTSVANVDLNSNTVYLNATSTGNGFGTAGIYAYPAVNLTMRNNLVVDLSTPTGGGRTVAFQRNNLSTPTYGASSNNNSFYAGVPSATHLVYYDGVSSVQTITAYRAMAAPKDANSISVNPAFGSTTGNFPNFLHIPNGSTNALESGGVAITGFTSDYDNDVRPGPAPSINGWGTAPDIGADEFDGIQGCNGTPTAGTATGAPGSICGPGAFNLSVTGYSEGPGYGIQWYSSTTSGGPYTIVSGATSAAYNTGTISTTTYYVCIVTCANSSLTAQTNEVTCIVKPVPATPAVSSNSPACIGSTINLSAPAVSGATYAWTGPNSFSSAVQNPTVSATAAAAGTYSLTVTVSGCTSATGTAAVVVNAVPAAPTPSSNTPVCTGNNINLSTSTVSGATYAWTGPASYSSAAQNPVLSNATLSMAGTYSLTVTVNGCTSAPGSTTVVVNQTPATPTASNNSPVCEGSTINFSTPAVAGAIYGWGGPNLFFGFSQNPSLPNATLALAGVYNVVITINGCTSAPGYTTVTVNPSPAAPTPSSNSPVCSGNTINLSTATVSGATYSWTGPSSFSSTAQNPSRTNVTTAMGGTYSVTVTANGCTSTAGTTNVVVNATPSTPTVFIPSAICTGNTLNMSASFVSGATYAWNGPNSFASSLDTPSITNVTTAASGTYSVTITANGCTSAVGTGTVTVNPTPATPIPSSNTPVCTGNTLNLSTPAVPGGTYSWTGPLSFTSTAQNPSRTNASTAMSGSYFVTVTANGCTSFTGTTSVVVNATPSTPTVNIPPAICTGGTLNMNTAVVSGATYAWNGPNSFTSSAQATSITNSTTAASGTYSVTVTVNGCTSAAGTGTTVVNPTPAAPVANSNSPVCTGNTLYLTMNTVPSASYYTWTDPSFNLLLTQSPSLTNATPSMAGTYIAYVTVNGCTSPGMPVAVVVNTTPATPTAAANSPVCAGNTINLGTATAPGATYAWAGPNSFTSAVQNPTLGNSTTAMSGTYSLTITSNGCTSGMATTSVTVNALPVVNANAMSVNVCNGTSATLYGSGASTYTWTGSVTDNVAFTPTATDTYTVTGTDANGCVDTGVITITVNPLPTVVANATATTVCAGTSITLNGSGAASYTWTGSVSDNVPFTATTTDTYTVTGADANGCTDTDVITINVNALPTVTANATATTVCAGTNVTLNGNGAVSYAWTGSVTDNVPFTATATDTYTVTGTDANGCSNTNVITVNVNALPTVTANVTNNIVCAGTPTTLSGSGAATYTWTGNVTDNVAFGPMATDTYTVTGTDANGCIDTDEITIYVYQLPTVTASANMTTLCAGSNVMLSGGGAVTYAWSGGVQNNNIFQAMTTETYTVTGTDASGCSDTAVITLTVNPLPAVVANTTATTVCYGTSVTLSGSGASTYTWQAMSAGVTDNVPFNATATDLFTVWGVDANGCVDTDTLTIYVNSLPTVTASASSTSFCIGGSLTLTGSGALSYTWTGGAIDNVPFTPVISDTYIVTGTDANGCQNTDQVFVSVFALPNITANATATAVCSGTNVTLHGSGPGVSSFTWTGSVIDNVAFTPATTDTYIVTGTDVFGCSNTDTITISVNALPTVTASATDSTVCSGTSVTLTGSGAASYTWTGSVTDNVPFNATATDTYTVTGTDANGCQDTATITINVNALPVVTLSIPQDTACLNGGMLTLSGESPAGGVWSGNNVSGNTFDPFVAGVGTHFITYTYTDANGCQAGATDNVYVDACSGIETVAATSWSIFPNPTNGAITITTGDELDGDVIIEIYTADGKLIRSESKQRAKTLILDMTSEPVGVYVVRILVNDKVSVHRVVKI